MFGPFHYVPVLKWKQGEYFALRDMEENAKEFITPIIELLDAGEKDWTEHIKQSTERIARFWGIRRPFFLELDLIEEFGVDDAVVHPARHIYEQAEQKGLMFIPVVRPYYDAELTLAALEHTDHGLCVRLRGDELYDDQTQSELRTLLDETELREDMIDLVLDFEELTMSELQARTLMEATLRTFSTMINWRTVTLLGTGFPHTMAGTPTGAISTIPRSQWRVWKQIIMGRQMQRLPSFGDYGIQHPELVDFVPGLMQPSATIRYALEDEWLLVRGYGVRSRKHGGFRQFKGLADELRKNTEFYGSTHCEGCHLINNIADRSENFGNLTTWRQIGTCHHLTVTVESIQALSAASDTSARAP